MPLGLGEFILFAALAGSGLYLLQAQRVRELALQAARRACRLEGVQLLDETVSLRRLSLSRDRAGRWRVWRQYRFEYTADGCDRRAGRVTMLGARLQGLVASEPDPR